MGFRAISKYWALVFCRTWKNARELFGWNTGTIISAILYIIGSIIYMYFKGWDAVIEESLVTTAYILAPLGAFLVLFVLWNLATVPVGMDAELRQQNIDLGTQIENKKKSQEVADYLQNAYSLAENLLSHPPPDYRLEENNWKSGTQWVVDSLKWYEDTSLLLKQHLTQNESFMFDTIINIPKRKPSYHEALQILLARREKLRLIINRYLQGIEGADLLADTNGDR